MTVAPERHGSHASVDIREYARFREKDFYVLKQYKVCSLEEGFKKLHDIQVFCDAANQLGIQTPSQGVFLAPADFDRHTRADEHSDKSERGGIFLNLVQEFGGQIMTESMQNGGNKEALVLTYLDQFEKVFRAGHPISLDPPLANFNDRGVLIDVFPPRHALNGTPLIEYSLSPDAPADHKKFMHERYYGPLQAVTIYAQILRAFGNTSIPSGFPDKVIDLIDKKLGSESAQKIWEALSLNLDHAKPTDIDAIRAIASYLHAKEQLSAQHLLHIFKVTHIEADTGKLPEQQNIDEAKAILCGIFN